MGFFNNIFGSSEPQEKKVLPWQNLTSTEQLDNIAKRSHSKTQIIFKHSTRCGVSRMVMNQFVSQYNLDANLDLYYLDLLSFREISNEISSKFQTIHESPQLLIIKNGVAVTHASHGAINELDLMRFE